METKTFFAFLGVFATLFGFSLYLTLTDWGVSTPRVVKQSIREGSARHGRGYYNRGYRRGK